jgi:hypothetical protein
VILFIPKVSNVDPLILADNTGQEAYKFKKVIFHKNAYDDEHRNLSNSNEEFQELRDLRLFDFDRLERDYESIGEFLVTGISFNKLGNEGGMFVE